MSKTSTETADICLLLEGTYPYVSGGVSTWVHQLIQAFPQWKFALFHIGAQKNAATISRYQIPPNVVSFEEIFLFDPSPSVKPTARKQLNSKSWNEFYQTLRNYLLHPTAGNSRSRDQLVQLAQQISSHPQVSFDDFFHAKATWKVLCEVYQRYDIDGSFLHFFWTSRYLIEPLWKLCTAMNSVPQAKVYHTACTGYAGFLGMLLAHGRQSPLMLSEHGIYLKERMQDILRSTWIPEFATLRPKLEDPAGPLHQLWMSFFDMLGRQCYGASNCVVSLFGKNARLQQDFGAPAERMTVIPNGIATAPCDVLYEQNQLRQQKLPQSRVVGFLGRVVSIKDIKTLLRAAKLVLQQMPDTKFLLAGPTEEEPEYYQECLVLKGQLGLDEQVAFLGACQRDEFLPRMDVMVLSSISEGLPFVALEALACGIPLVSTDVGACREVIEGAASEAPSLGCCGRLARVGDAQGLANGLLELLGNRALQQQMGMIGRERIRRYYHEGVMVQAYQKLYGSYINLNQAGETWQA